MNTFCRSILLATLCGGFVCSSGYAEDAPRAFTANIKGYALSCKDRPEVYKQVNGNWEKAATQLPGKGTYYLDGKWVGYGMCDVVSCQPIEAPYSIPLVEYIHDGEKAAPPDNGQITPMPVAAYRTVALAGGVKIVIDYYADKECREHKRFEAIVK